MTVEVPQIQFIAELVTFQFTTETGIRLSAVAVYGGGEGFFVGFSSASFSEPSMVKSHRGLPCQLVHRLLSYTFDSLQLVSKTTTTTLIVFFKKTPKAKTKN